MGRWLGHHLVWIILALCALAFVSVIITKRSASHRAVEAGARELEKQIALAHRAGVPLGPDDFVDQPPKLHSAADLYDQAGWLLSAELELVGPRRPKAVPLAVNTAPVGIPPGPTKPGIGKSSSAGRDSTRALLAQAGPALILMQRAAKMRSVEGLSLGDTNRRIGFAAKMIPRLASDEAEISASDGHAKAGLIRLATFAPLCGQLSRLTEIGDIEVEIEAESSIVAAITRVLRDHGREPGVAEAAEHVLEALGPQPTLERAIERENYRLLHSPEWNSNPAATWDSSSGEDPVDRGSQVPGMVERWKALQVEATRRLTEVVRSIGDDWIGAENRISSIQGLFSEPDDDLHAEMRATGFCNSWANRLDRIAVGLSHRRILAQSMSVFESWRRTGKLPDKLPLNGPTLYDPLGSGPFHYSHNANSFTIYGAGPHGVNHGGKPLPPRASEAGYDIVFTYR